MSVVWLIVRREFLARVRGRGYLIATVVGVLAILALNFAPALGQILTEGRPTTFAVVDPSGLVLPRLKAELKDTLSNGKPQYTLVPAQGGQAGLDRQVQTGKITGAIVVPAGAVEGSSQPIVITTKGSLRPAETARVRAALGSALVFARLQERGISPAQATGLFATPPLENRSVGTGSQKAPGTESYVLTYVLVILLYTTVLVYGTYIAMGVIEEKSTRVVEILISTVRPFQLMLGKVLGTGLAALLQYFLWVLAGFGLLLARGAFKSISVGSFKITFSAIDPWLLVAFLGFFVLGFFSYAGLFAAGGSLVSRSEDAQQVTTPLSLALVLVFFVAIYALSSPDAPVSVVFSMLPLAGPIVMFVRVSLSDPPAWQVGLSVLLSLVAIVALIALAARIFRAGVLLYGRRLGLRTILEALK